MAKIDTIRRRGKRGPITGLALALLMFSSPVCADSRDDRQQAADFAFDRLGQEMRLQSVGYRLALANASRCERPQMLTGLLLHSISGYPQTERKAVAEAYNITYGFGVLGVVPGSAADAAGLAEGDEIVSVNGSDLAGFAADSIAKAGSYDRTERFYGYLDTALRSGPGTLELRRGEARIAVRLAGASGCGGQFAMLQRRSLNAWSDGRYVAVTDRMMRQNARRSGTRLRSGA